MLVLKERKKSNLDGFGGLGSPTYVDDLQRIVDSEDPTRGRLTPQQKKMQEEALAQRERELATGRVQSEIVRKEQGSRPVTVGRKPVGYIVMDAEATMRQSLQKEEATMRQSLQKEADDLVRRQKTEIQQLKNYQNTLTQDIKNKAANQSFKSQAELDNQVANSIAKIKTRSEELKGKHVRENRELQEKFKEFSIKYKPTGAINADTVRQNEAIIAAKDKVISNADIASISATKAAASVMKLAGLDRLSGFGAVKPLSRGGSGIQRPLSTVASAIARAKEQAGVPASKMPVYKSPLLAAREQQQEMARGGYIPETRVDSMPIEEAYIEQPYQNVIEEPSYQEPSYQVSSDFDIETAKQNVIQMKEAIEKFTAIVIKGKSEIAKAKKEIAEGRRQIAAI